MKILLKTLASALILSGPLAALAAPVAVDLDPQFRQRYDANVMDSATKPHVTVQGTLANGTDSAWFQFTGQAGSTLYLDHDDQPNNDTLHDTNLWLFNSSGSLLAYALYGAPDEGSDSFGNAFLGAYTLQATDTYYIAVTVNGFGVDLSNTDQVGMSFLSGGGYSIPALGANFGLTGGDAGAAGGSFTLQVTNSEHDVPVPEPGSLALTGVALAGLAGVRRRQRGRYALKLRLSTPAK